MLGFSNSIDHVLQAPDLEQLKLPRIRQQLLVRVQNMQNTWLEHFDCVASQRAHSLVIPYVCV